MKVTFYQWAVKDKHDEKRLVSLFWTKGENCELDMDNMGNDVIAPILEALLQGREIYVERTGIIEEDYDDE